MKVWRSYGSEHSARLVLIGHFKEASEAESAQELIEKCRELASATESRVAPDRYTDEEYEFMRRNKIFSVGPNELEQFFYDFNIEVQGTELVLKTNELDVSALLKVLIERGARIELYSAHHYPDSDA